MDAPCGVITSLCPTLVPKGKQLFFLSPEIKIASDDFNINDVHIIISFLGKKKQLFNYIITFSK